MGLIEKISALDIRLKIGIIAGIVILIVVITVSSVLKKKKRKRIEEEKIRRMSELDEKLTNSEKRRKDPK